jgi:hypothetical protein
VNQRLAVLRLGHRVLHAFHAREHVGERAETAHALHLTDLGPEIVEVELALGHLGRELFGVLDLDRLRRLLDQADDVAHAEDSPGDPFRVEGFERVQPLADAGELDRLAGDRPHGQRRAAARIAVEAREDDAAKIDLAGKALGDVDRVLAGETVNHEQGFGRVRRLCHGLHLGHQRIVDVEAARGVEKHYVIGLQLRRLDRAFGNLHRLLAGDDRQRVDTRLPSEHRQLLLRGGAGDVERRHQDLLSILFSQPPGEFGSSGGLTRALEPDHHHDRGRIHVHV